MKKLLTISLCAIFAHVQSASALSSCREPGCMAYNQARAGNGDGGGHNHTGYYIAGGAIVAVAVTVGIWIFRDRPERIESRQEREYREWLESKNAQ